MIEGIGVDLVSTDRIKKIIDENRKTLLNRIFSQEELNSGNRGKGGRYAEKLAGIFAAKEALLKAVGGGLFSLPLSGIHIFNKTTGEPFIEINDNLKKLIFQKFKKKIGLIRLSITHENGMACAFVIIES